MGRRFRILVLLIPLTLALLPNASAQSEISATENEAVVEFPDHVTFRVELESDATISQVVLEYGVEQLTCGTVVAKAFPEFRPAKTVSASWTWEMRQSGSEPPGATVWWRWHATDAEGTEFYTDRQTVVWLDDVHPWETISRGSVNLHWYEGSRSFATELHTAALDALATLARTTGLEADSTIEVYIYADQDDLREAVLYEPGWTGGLAYIENNIVIIGVSPDQLEWGRDAIVHELTHVLLGHTTFTCLGEIPTWLHEGLAVYGEGGPDRESLRLFEAAVREDTLLSVRALSGGFSEDPAKANIAYTQSYSIVEFLISEFGRDSLLDLLAALRDGVRLDDALLEIYGFDVDGLEDAWREEIGAEPRAVGTPEPTARPTPIPTIVPIPGVPFAPTATRRVGPPSPTSGQVTPVTGRPSETGAPPTPTAGPPTPTALTATPTVVTPTATPSPTATPTPGKPVPALLIALDWTLIVGTAVTGILIVVLIVVLISKRRQRTEA